MIYDIEKIRSNFPFLQQKIYQKRLIYLDNAATTQKPACVLDKIMEVYTTYNGNVHRGNHYLSGKATEEYEGARTVIANYIHGASAREILFTKGATEGINLVASTYGRQLVKKGDKVLVGMGEHHSNYLPWQYLCREQGAKFQVISLMEDGTLNLEVLKENITPQTKIVAVSHMSNVLGCINNIKEIAGICHEKGIVLFVDGAQAIAHTEVDVQELDCDFYCFSGHKLYGPTGIGVLYGKESLLSQMKPYELGGEMAADVGEEESTYACLPFYFEAGTPNYVGAIALAEAVKFMGTIGMDAISNHEKKLWDYLIEKMQSNPAIRVYTGKRNGNGILSFSIISMDSYDAAKLLDLMGFELRVGAHCAQPMMRHLGVEHTLRLSLACYNNMEEMGLFLAALDRVIAIGKGERK